VQPDVAPLGEASAFAPPPDPFLSAGLATLGLDQRSFWDGHDTVLDFALEDATTGDVLWSATVRSDADPRDHAAMAKLVLQALGRAPFLRVRP